MGFFTSPPSQVHLPASELITLDAVLCGLNIPIILSRVFEKMKQSERPLWGSSNRKMQVLPT